jgi:hypothetical protein
MRKSAAKKERQELSSRGYEKLSEWLERAALLGLGSLVVQQIVEGVPLFSQQFILGTIATGLVYLSAYRVLQLADKSKI